jgi:hypothetical protein
MAFVSWSMDSIEPWIKRLARFRGDLCKQWDEETALVDWTHGQAFKTGHPSRLRHVDL